jgi:hypothetical protein
MKSLLPVVVAAALLGLSPASATAKDLTEAAVSSMVAAVDRAIPARDLVALRLALADDALITLNLDLPGQPERVILSKDEYLAMVEKAWGMATEYSYRRSNQTIELRGELAIVSADVWESLTANGRRMVTESRETALITEIDGRLQITAIAVQSKEPKTQEVVARR